jgi:hypothetical protein
MCKHLTDFSDVSPNIHLLIRVTALIANLFFLILVTAGIANLAFLIHYERDTKRSVEKKDEKEQQREITCCGVPWRKRIYRITFVGLLLGKVMCNKNMNIKIFTLQKRCHT